MDAPEETPPEPIRRRPAGVPPSALLARATIGVASSSPARSDRLATALRGCGAKVSIFGPGDVGAAEAGAQDPDLLMILPDWLATGGDLGRVRRHPRLRWARVWVLPERAVQNNPLGMPGFLGMLELELRAGGCGRRQLPTSLEHIGPAKLVRAVGSRRGTWSLSIRSDVAETRIEFAEGLVVAARAWTDGKAESGVPALTRVLSLTRGTIACVPLQLPARLELALTIDAALHQASEALELEHDDREREPFAIPLRRRPFGVREETPTPRRDQLREETTARYSVAPTDSADEDDTLITTAEQEWEPNGPGTDPTRAVTPTEVPARPRTAPAQKLNVPALPPAPVIPLRRSEVGSSSPPDEPDARSDTTLARPRPRRQTDPYFSDSSPPDPTETALASAMPPPPPGALGGAGSEGTRTLGSPLESRSTSEPGSENFEVSSLQGPTPSVAPRDVALEPDTPPTSPSLRALARPKPISSVGVPEPPEPDPGETYPRELGLPKLGPRHPSGPDDQVQGAPPEALQDGPPEVLQPWPTADEAYHGPGIPRPPRPSAWPLEDGAYRLRPVLIAASFFAGMAGVGLWFAQSWNAPEPPIAMDKPEAEAPAAGALEPGSGALPSAPSRVDQPEPATTPPDEDQGELVLEGLTERWEVRQVGPLPRTAGARRRARARSDELVAEAQSHEAAGDRDEARQAYLRSAATAPFSPHPWAGLAALALEEGDLDDALLLARHAVDKRPQRKAYRLLLGDVYAARGQRPQAARQYRRAGRLYPFNSEAQERLRSLAER